MRLGLYKPGQGYWVRMLTAAFAAIIVAVGGAWMYRSLGAVDLPKPTWTIVVTQAASLAPGQTVSLIGEPPQPGFPGKEVGTAEVISVGAPAGVGGQQVIVKKMTLKAGSDVTQVKSVKPPGEAAASVGVIGLPVGKPIFELLYLQAAGVAVLVLIGGIAVFWFVGSRPRSVEFLIATDGEMKKVNWSTRKDIIGSTQVVILWSLLLVGGLFFVDLAFSTFFRLIGVLQTK